MSNNENTNICGENRSMTNEILDGPLIIVLDEDNDDDDFDEVPINRNQEKSTDVTHSPNKGISPKDLQNSASLSKRSRSVPKSKQIRTILVDTSLPPQTSQSNRPKKAKPIVPPKPQQYSSSDSAISSMTFDKIANILTISRMGSIYYCVEDIYLKIFSSLCTFEDLMSLLIKPEIVFLKDVNLSEKLSLTRENVELKRFNHARYRLIPIDSSEYILKLKQSLLAHKRINKIIVEMRTYKQTSTNHAGQEKIESKSPPVNDPIPSKRQKKAIPPTANLSKSIATIRIDNILSEKRSYRSKSLNLNRQRPRRSFPHSSSLPCVQIDAKNQTIQPSIDAPDNNFPMPMIVQIEENVQLDDLINKSPPPSPPPVSEPSPMPTIPYPYHYQPPSFYLSPIRTPYNLYYPDTNPFPSTCLNSQSSVKVHSSPIITSLLEKPIQQNPSLIARHSLTFPPNAERLLRKKPTYPQRCTLKTIQTTKPKYQRLSLTPYPPTKILYAPLSSQSPSSSERPRNINIRCTKTFVPISSSNQTQSVDLPRAILDHNQCDLDKIPKLVIRHRKIYLSKAIDTMGQLFPTWFKEPDYRCIHCFTCDRVFTPQLFMTHIDDQALANEKLLEMTPIQLLTSEKMSESKVHLWNTFCTSLTLYASRNPQKFADQPE